MEIRGLCVGINFAYFINTKQNVRTLELNNFSNVNNLNSSCIKFEENNLFPVNRQIVGIYAGLNFFVAMEREEIPPMEEWDNDRVV